mmetsp:Transcript_14962/g.32120  ORF Transcript_14962/g.32120 Transcript_14962/m.32120 type:complete len:359 (-) Transcript_14962:1329-2405(-)
MGSSSPRSRSAFQTSAGVVYSWHRRNQTHFCCNSRLASAPAPPMRRLSSRARSAVSVSLNDSPQENSVSFDVTESSHQSSFQRFTSTASSSRELYGIPELESGQRLTLDDIRDKLIRQEETIIFALIERAQFMLNKVIYEAGGIEMDGYSGSFSDFLLFELEKVYARVRRYTSPDEHAFSPPEQLPEPMLNQLQYPSTIVDNSINLNDRLHQVYVESIVPSICAEGDDQNYGSSAVCDVGCLQALSKRIHYGKFVAEAKFQANESEYTPLIKEADRDALWELLTDIAVEDRLLQRVYDKACMIGQDVDASGRATPAAASSDNEQISYKLEPRLVMEIYRDHIIPLTKDVQVEYLLLRA